MADITLLSALQWGEEDAVLLSDYLSEDADIIITALKGMKKENEEGAISLHLLTPAVFRKEAMTIIPGGMCVDLDVLKKDYEALSEKGFDVDSLFIDERTNLVLPFHNGSGVSAEFSKMRRSGLRAGDLLDDERLPGRLSRVLMTENRMDLYYEVMKKCKEWKLFFADYIIDTVPIIRYAAEADQKVIIEADGGLMKDVSWGTYPMTASFRNSAASMLEKAGLPPKAVTRTIGVAKAISERADDGPIISAFTKEAKKGWIDCVALDYACFINGVDTLCITDLDALDQEPQIKVCTGYMIEGEYYSNLPESRKQDNARAIYAEFEGWMTDTRAISKWSDLPEKCIELINQIGTYVNAEVGYISTGGRIIAK